MTTQLVVEGELSSVNPATLEVVGSVPVTEPLGVLGIISPWNFPFSIPLTQTAMAVAAGNAVVLKPSELTPLSGEWVARTFAEAGAPDGLVRVAQGAGETGAALVGAPGVAKVIFTGSGATGRKVLAGAA